MPVASLKVSVGTEAAVKHSCRSDFRHSLHPNSFQMLLHRTDLRCLFSELVWLPVNSAARGLGQTVARKPCYEELRLNGSAGGVECMRKVKKGKKTSM